MSDRAPIPAHVIHQADQETARSNANLDALIAMFRGGLDSHDGNHLYAWAGLAHAVIIYPPTALADLLAAAINRLVRLEDERNADR